MLGCPCKMIKPFTFATAKKSSALRYNSFARMSLGCSCYHMKNLVLVHLVRSRHFGKRAWDVQNSLVKEQKNFFWTHYPFWKTSEDKITSNKDKGTGTKCSEKADPPLDIILSDNLSKTPESNPVSTSHDSPKFSKGSLGQSDKNIKNLDQGENAESQLKSLIRDRGSLILKSNDIVSADVDEKNKLSAKQSPDKLENYVIKNIILSESKKKAANLNHPQDVPGIDTKVLVKPCKKDKVIEPSESTKSDCNEEVKRQACTVSLGEVTKDTVLKESPNVFSSDTSRRADEIQFLKDGQKFLEKAKNILRKTSSSTAKPDENERTPKKINLGEPKGNLNVSTTARRRQTVDLNRSSTERNFITPVRAMTDFLLKPSDLEGLRKTKRRSPYENDPPITVYWRKDVEAKALDVWGSKENLLKEILKRDIERRRYQQNLFTVKRRLRDYRREQGRESEIKVEQNGLFGSSGKVVLTAIAINGANFMFKLTAWLYTGSHSMFSETIHSLADTINQLILAYGIHKSVQRADSDHPYGYTNMRYVASLISGVGIFCVGSGLSFYHGVVGLADPSDLPSFYWAFFILGGSLASEGATLLVAFNSIRLGARKSDMSFSEYVFRGQDPSVNVVLLEDTAAVIGVGFAGTCMGLSSYYNSHVPDAIGSFLVGGLLACVASFIIYTNVAALVGRSIPQERLDKINTELESDVMIRAIHDVKGIDIGNSLVRYKAEMDFDGGELTRSYLDKQDLNQMLEEVRKMQTIDELEEFLLKHGENIVDMMGGEIDRIELKLRKKHPEIRHCDLEIL